MKKLPKVLHIFHGLGMGGAETWIYELIKWDCREKSFQFDIEILITGGKIEYWDEKLIELGVKINYIPFGKNTVLNFITNFRKLLKSTNYIAIHDHQELFSGWHFLFGLGYLPKVRITHFHNPSYQMASNYGKSFDKKTKLFLGKLFVLLFASHIRGTSYEILIKSRVTSKLFQSKSPTQLHCSFDFEKFKKHEISSILRSDLKISSLTKIVLIVGRFDYNIVENHCQNHKNTAFTLSVLSELNNEDIVFIYAGANYYSLIEFNLVAAKLGVENKIKLLGIRNDVHLLMNEADLLFFPSREEGLGMVAVEAQVAGLPVLVSTGVPNECVIINELVTFLDLNESKKVWSDKIKQIISSPKPNYTEFKRKLDQSNFNIKNTSLILNQLYNNG